MLRVCANRCVQGEGGMTTETQEVEIIGGTLTPDDFDLSKLDPELRPYMRKSVFGMMLQHPLVQQLPPIHVTLANQSLRLKEKALQEAIDEGNWHQAIWWHERPWRLLYFDMWARAGRIPDEQRKELFADVWIDAESPSSYGVRRVVDLFKHVGFTTDMEQPETFALPKQPVQLYRGVRDQKHARRVSWTKSGHKAAWFAKRYSLNGEGYVYEAMVDPKLILGIFQGRGEDEVVIDITRLPKNALTRVQ